MQSNGRHCPQLNNNFVTALEYAERHSTNTSVHPQQNNSNNCMMGSSSHQARNHRTDGSNQSLNRTMTPQSSNVSQKVSSTSLWKQNMAKLNNDPYSCNYNNNNIHNKSMDNKHEQNRNPTPKQLHISRTTPLMQHVAQTNDCDSVMMIEQTNHVNNANNYHHNTFVKNQTPSNAATTMTKRYCAITPNTHHVMNDSFSKSLQGSTVSRNTNSSLSSIKKSNLGFDPKGIVLTTGERPQTAVPLMAGFTNDPKNRSLYHSTAKPQRGITEDGLRKQPPGSSFVIKMPSMINFPTYKRN